MTYCLLYHLLLLLALFLTAWTKSSIRESSLCPSFPGICMNSVQDKMAGTKLPNFTIIDESQKSSCLEECLKVENATGCQFIWKDVVKPGIGVEGKGCYVVQGEQLASRMDFGDDGGIMCWDFNKCQGNPLSLSYCHDHGHRKTTV